MVTAAVMGVSANAHDFYINLIAPNEAKPWSATASIGWGHTLPFEDFFGAKNLQSYEIYDPNMKKMALKFDENTNMEAMKLAHEKPSKDFPQANVVSGDGYMQRIFFNDDSKQGVYQVAATTEMLHFAEWIDEKGRERWGKKYLDELKDAKEIKSCRTFQSFAKAYVGYGEWKKPSPIGHELELVPISDLSNVKVGDEVEFEVLFMGKPLDGAIDGIPSQIRAHGEQSGAGFIGAYVSGGKAKFRVTSSGKWTAVLNIRKSVNEKTAPELVGKALQKGYNASVTFGVKER